MKILFDENQRRILLKTYPQSTHSFELSSTSELWSKSSRNLINIPSIKTGRVSDGQFGLPGYDIDYLFIHSFIQDLKL